MEEKFRHRLDLFYLACIGYTVTLIAYVIIGGAWVADKFELVWKDPIVYLLASCAAISLIALLVAAILRRRVIVRNDQVVLRTRFKERILTPSDILWIALRREQRTGQRAYPVVGFKLANRRRLLRMRPGGFERSPELLQMIHDWARRNGVEIRGGKRRRKPGTPGTVA